MNTGRLYFCMAHLNAYFYVLGGWDHQHNTIKTCERYSFDDGRWEYIADLNQPRRLSTCAAVSKENCLYLIGGKMSTDEYIKTIEKYDVYTDS